MTTPEMEYLEPLSFESMMEVQERNSLYSSRSIPSVQSWRLPPHSLQELNSPSRSIQESSLIQGTCVLNVEALSSLSSSTYQTRVFCSFYDTSSRNSGITRGRRADSDGFITCFKARIHDEFNDNYGLGHGLRKSYFDLKDNRNGFAASVGKLVAQYDKTHDQRDVFEFTQSVRTDSEGNPDQLVNSTGRTPVGVPHGDEKLNKSAKSQGQANDDIQEDMNQAANELNNEGSELSDGTQKLLEANQKSQQHRDSVSKSKKKRKKKGKRNESDKGSTRPEVKDAPSSCLLDIIKNEYEPFWRTFGAEGAQSVIDAYHSSIFLPEELKDICSEHGTPMILVACFYSPKYIVNFRLFMRQFMVVTSTIPILYCPESKEFRLGYIEGMDYPAAGNSMLSIAMANDMIEGVFKRRRSINSYATDLQKHFTIGEDYVNKVFRHHQTFTTLLAHFVIGSILSLLPKASTDETTLPVLSVQGRSKESDQIRSNRPEGEVSHITVTSQPYAAVWKSLYPSIPAVVCNLSFGRGIFDLEVAAHMFWTDVDRLLNGGDFISLKHMLSDGLQAYAYEASVYGIELFMCHAHGRREFFGAANPLALRSLLGKLEPKERLEKLMSFLKGNNSNIAFSIILSLYSAFFAQEQKVQELLEESRNLNNQEAVTAKSESITDEAEGDTADPFKLEAIALREGPMRELLDLIYEVIDTLSKLYTKKADGKYVSVTKGDKYASACVYMLNNKAYFYNCLKHVEMAVHNNETEQVMSGIALQRKNGYLTVSVTGAELDCATRSVIETLEANGLDITKSLNDLSHVTYRQLYELIKDDEVRKGNIGYNKAIETPYAIDDLPMPDEDRLREMLPYIDFAKLIPVLFNETAQSAIKNLGNSNGTVEDIYQKINDRAHELLKDWLIRFYEQQFRTKYASIERFESSFNKLEDEFNSVADEYEQHMQSSAAASGSHPESGVDSPPGTSPGPDISPEPESGHVQNDRTQLSSSEAGMEETSQKDRLARLLEILKIVRRTSKNTRLKASDLEMALTGEQEADAVTENAKADEFAKELGLITADESDGATVSKPLSTKSFLSFINQKIGRGLERCALMQQHLESDTSSRGYDLKLVKCVIPSDVLKKINREFDLLGNTDKSLRSRGMAGSNIVYGISFLIDHVSLSWHNAHKAAGDASEELRTIADHSINWLSSFLKDCRERMNNVFLQIAHDAQSRSNAMEDKLKMIEDRIVALNIELPARK